MDYREDNYSERMLDQLDVPEISSRRMVILPWAIWATVIGITLGAALYPVIARAAEVFRSTDDRGGPMVLKLYKEKCENAAVNSALLQMQIAPQFLFLFKRATLFYWGREWASCWLEHDGRVLSIDEQGSPLQPIPRSMFKDDTV